LSFFLGCALRSPPVLRLVPLDAAGCDDEGCDGEVAALPVEPDVPRV
jgi:hypothetical protein